MTRRPSRRALLRGTALFGGALLPARLAATAAPARTADELRIGLVGCGRRGTAAAAQALQADAGVRLVALADAFEDALAESLATLARAPELAARVDVPPARRFVGFEAYQGLLACDLDVVLLATPPHFRPLHVRAVLEANKHVFAEKPAAVDAPGVRSVLASAAFARAQGLALVSGLNLRALPELREGVARVHGGALGEIRSLFAVRFGGAAWQRTRQPGWSEMEAQLRDWLYYPWLSGDFLVEQFVHQLDLATWLLGEQYPVRCTATGGRQARTAPEFGQIYDHFSCVYEYANGARFHATTRQQVGCSEELSNHAYGTAGTFVWGARGLRIEGAAPWRPEREPPADMHQAEQDAFFAALRKGLAPNEGETLAKSTLMALLGRMCAYTGRALTWDEALASQAELRPSAYAFDAVPPAAEVAIPGVTKFS